MRKILALLIAFILVFAGCAEPAEPTDIEVPEEEKPELTGDVVVLYTNDVHCAIDENMGYTGLAAVKSAFEKTGNTVILVDIGDALQGTAVGTLSKGEYIIDIMNQLEYDVAVPGNHEFHFGVEYFIGLTEKAGFPYVCVNFEKEGSPVFAPYEIIEAEGVKIAFVGVCTPETLVAAPPKNFQDEAGNYIYGFCQDETGEKLYAVVQDAVDAARAEGADYVFALAHLGTNFKSSPWTSYELIENTVGIDAVLDGHSHSVIENEIVVNRSDENVVLASSGTKFENIGCLTLDKDGTISTTLISDNGTFGFIGEIEKEYGEIIAQVIARSEVDLSINDPVTGERAVRNRETNIGNLCADAYRTVSGADISLVNGGAIRTGFSKGNITYGNIVALFPFSNSMAMIETTGQDILDALEFGAAKLPLENGAFLQVSGLTYEIDLNVESSVTVDENGSFKGVSGQYRVKNVMIGGEPLDVNKLYTVAGNDFMIKNGGDGFSMFVNDTVLIDGTVLDIEAIGIYISEILEGNIGNQYSNHYGEGRITITEKK